MFTDNQIDQLVASGAFGRILNNYMDTNPNNKISDEKFGFILDSYLLDPKYSR
jgi:hypothetical protein